MKFQRIFIVLLLLSVVAACSTPQVAPTDTPTLTVTDALGRTVSFETPPQRIVVGGNGALMIVDALLSFPEGQERLVAYSKTDQGKGSFTEAVLTDGTAEIIEDRTSVEAIAGYQPDVVLLKSYMVDLGNTLEEINIPVIYLDLETFTQYQKDMQNLSALLANTSRAEELIAYYSDIVAAVDQQVSNIKEEAKPTVLFAYYDTKDGAVALKVPPLEWAQTEMIERAGGIPVWKDISLGSSWTVIGFEQIAAWDPDVIFLTSYFANVDEVKTTLLADSQWQQLEALKQGRLYAFPMAFYSWDQPHTRWGIVQLWLANKLHPEDFSSFDFNTEAIRFYQLFYEWDEAQYQEVIVTRLQGDISPQQ